MLKRPLPHFFLLVCLLSLAPEQVKARKCIGHAYQIMELDLKEVLHKGKAVKAPPFLSKHIELMNSSDRGKLLLFRNKPGNAFAKFFRLKRAYKAPAKEAKWLKMIQARTLRTSCGTNIPYTPILPGVYVFDQEHSTGKKTSALVDKPIAYLYPWRDTLLLEFTWKGKAMKARYQRVCQIFPWKGNKWSCRSRKTTKRPVPKKVAKRSPVRPVCKALLKAYQAKDLKGIVRYCNKFNKRMLGRLLKRIQKGNRHAKSRLRSIFGTRSWRMRAVMSWDGKIRSARGNGKVARCRFLQKTKATRFPVVVMQWENGAWRFEDINNQDQSDWKQRGKRIP